MAEGELKPIPQPSPNLRDQEDAESVLEVDPATEGPTTNGTPDDGSV